ncbi:MAG: hypothetical protein JSV62_09115 [Promethearchaeota archaeon]|nr:MAG: hypothetical protein JSV62_09115 [Candidatus Lokiarchaeota archaeon]
MKSIHFKRKTLKKILCLVIFLINSYIIFDNPIKNSYVKSSKIEEFLLIRNSNINATRFEDFTYDSEVVWGNNITFSLNFTYTEDNGTTWYPVLNPYAYCNITITDLMLTTDFIKTNMTSLGDGIFFKAINSSRLSAGGSSEMYFVTIEGSCPGYPDPLPEIFLITINAIPTGLSMHNYSTYEKLTTNELYQYYNEIINVTFKYYNSNSNNSLIADSFTYSWDYGSGTLNIDPRNSDYYILEINTSLALHTDKYSFQISAALENYTTLNYIFFLNILSRPTTLNGETGLIYISSKLWVQEAHNFTFTYKDAVSNETIGNLDVATYIWEGLYANGTVIPGRNGSGNLTQNLNKTYTLDFNTELRPVGYYFLYITLQKDNYIHKNAFINLEIIPRPTLINGTTLNLTIFKAIEFKTPYNFTFEINDTLTHSRIGDLDQAFYYWYRTDSIGTILEGPSLNVDLIKDLNNLYILDFNTELRSAGFYRIHVEFHKENYSSRYSLINLEIIPKPTLINRTTLTLIIFKSIEFMTAYNFTFEIINTLTHSRIGDLDHAFYYWYRTNIFGTNIEGPSQNIDLIKDLNDLYILDFNTNLKSIGFYRIHVEFHKENYTSRYAIIYLIIYPPSENLSLKIIGYDLTILLGVISIITLAIKKKIFDQGLKKR